MEAEILEVPAAGLDRPPSGKSSSSCFCFRSCDRENALLKKWNSLWSSFFFEGGSGTPQPYAAGI